MSVFNARGIVIGETLVSESDKRVTLLLKERGKVTAYAKGARKATSKLLAGTQLFAYSDFVLYDGGRFLSVTQIELIESFYNIRNDYDRLCIGSYFLELCNRTLMEGEPWDDVLLLLIRSLSALKKAVLGAALVSDLFELRFLQLNGYEPEVNRCILCGEQLTAGGYLTAEGVICEACIKKAPERGAYVTRLELDIIRFALNSPINKLFAFNIPPDVTENLNKAVKYYATSHKAL